MRKQPVFVMAAVSPYAFQLHSPQASEPIHKGYKRFTIAGVLTGYNKQAEKPYWEMLVRRHGKNNNQVRILLDTHYPFGGMENMAYLLQADTEDVMANSPTNVVCEVCSLKELNDLPADVTLIRVLPHCMNEEVMSLQINNFPDLRVFEVGSRSLQLVESLELSGLPNLQSVFIGDNSFSRFDGSDMPAKSSKKRMLTIASNPSLQTVVLGAYSFSEYEEFIVKGR